MKIRDVDKVCIVDIAGKTVSQSDLIDLKKLFFEKASKQRIGINLEKVLSINHDFINFLQESSFNQKLSVFNANNEVYLLLFVSKNDKYVNIYLNENDFFEDKHCIVYRRLKLLKSA